MKRVFIKLAEDESYWGVFPVDRMVGGIPLGGLQRPLCFFVYPDYTREEVVEWIKEQTDLELIS